MRKLYIKRKCIKCRGSDTECVICKGEHQRDEINLFIWMGTSPATSYKYIFHGDGFDATILNVKIVELRHNLYRRNGQNLIINASIEVIESLLGFHRIIEALDGRKLLIKKEHCKTTMNNERCMVSREGLPYYENGEYKAGDLIIYFRVTPLQEKDVTDDLVKVLNAVSSDSPDGEEH